MSFQHRDTSFQIELHELYRTHTMLTRFHAVLRQLGPLKTQNLQFFGKTIRDSLRNPFQYRLAAFQIELDELYRMHTLLTRFHAPISSYGLCSLSTWWVLQNLSWFAQKHFPKTRRCFPNRARRALSNEHNMREIMCSHQWAITILAPTANFDHENGMSFSIFIFLSLMAFTEDASCA
jgi:hypothetical protein